MQAGFSAATVIATSGEEEASSNREMKNPRAPAPRPARGSRCPQQLLLLRRRWQPRTLRGPGEPVHMLLWRGGAQRLAEDVLFKGQLPGSTRESDSPAPFPRPLPSLWVKAERGGDAQVQVGMLEPRSYQAELQAAEPWMQRMQPLQGSSKRPGALPRCSVRERASYRSWRCDYCEGTVSAQLGAVGSLGSGYAGRQGETTATTPDSLLRLLEPAAPICWFFCPLLHQLSKGLRRQAPWMTEEDPRGSSKRALPSVLCCLLTSRSPVSRPGQ